MQAIASWVFTALAGAGVGVNAAAFLAANAVRLGAALVLSALSAAQQKKPRQQDLARELQQPDGLPTYRHVVGNTEAPGTPAPADLVVDGVLYGCWLLNSRPSEGNFTLYLDKREVELTGDPYDFSDGGGATATNAPFAGYLKVWFGLGDQTTPPVQITDEVPWAEDTAETQFKTTDAWQGRTVVWMRLHRGPNNGRQERWPSTPPAVAVRGDFSKVYDPREPAHDLDDPTTWAFSRNQALITLDAVLNNPVAPHGLSNVIIDSFKWAADVADEAAPLKAGGTEPRFEAGGVLTFTDSEIEDQLGPLVAAGGSQLFRAGGRLGIVPATWQDPVYTLTDLIGDQYEYRATRRGRDMYGKVRTTYTSADRGYESADLGDWDIPGGDASLRAFDQRLDFVQSAPQAQRLRKIQGLRLIQERLLSSVAPPDMSEILPGATIAVNLAGRGRLNGAYQLASAHPAASPLGDEGGVALRVPFEMTETTPDIFEWNPAIDEQDVIVPDFEPSFEGTAIPGDIDTQSGADVDLDTGGAVVPRVLFSFAPSDTPSVTHYEWQFKNWTVENYGVWTSGGVIDGELRDAAGDVFGYLSGLSPLAHTMLRARALGPAGVSDWSVSATIVLDFDLTLNSVSAGTGTADFNVTAPTTTVFAGVQIYRSATSDFAAATAVSGIIPVAVGATTSVQATGLASGVGTFWVTPVTTTGAQGDPVGPETLTIT